MNTGEVYQTPIDGVVVRANKLIRHDRGTLAELMPGGLENDLAMGEFGNLYLTTSDEKGGDRGGHYHKLDNSYESFYMVGGTVVWLLHDYRKDSPTHGVTMDIVVGETRPNLELADTLVFVTEDGSMPQVVIPPGVYHGYVQLSDDAAQIIGYHTKPYQEDDYERIDLSDVPDIDTFIKKYSITIKG